MSSKTAMSAVKAQLQERWQLLQGYWHGLSRREQQLCLLGAVTLSMLMLWYGVVTPLAERREMAELRLHSSRQQLLQIEEQASEILSLRQGQPDKARYLGLPLDELVNRTAREFELRVTGVRAQGDSLQVDLVDTGFDRLLDWLEVLEQQGGVEIRELDVEALEKPGQVSVESLRIQRKS